MPNPQEINVDDLISSYVNQLPQEQNVEDVLSNLGSYTPPAEETSVASEYYKNAHDFIRSAVKGGGSVLRGAMQTAPGAVIGGEIGGPVGAAIGGMAVPFGDLLNSAINRATGANLRMPSEIISTNLAKMGLAEPTSQTERILEAAGAGLGGATAEIPAMFKAAQSAVNPVAQQLGQQFINTVGRQTAVAPLAAGTGQLVSEETDNPFAGMLASLGIGGASGIRLTKKAIGAPSHEDLVVESKNLYDKAKASGVEFKSSEFNSAMEKISKDLRSEGYTPGAYPGIASVLDEMKLASNPKDFTELQSIRKMIQNQQASNDPNTRRIASELKDKFDDYVLNAPQHHITAGSKQGLEDWKDARTSYSRLKKSEIFDTMLTNAELDQSKFTQSGAENSMAQQLRQLAKNEKKMRLFTAEEQNAIREAAKGTTPQKMLKFYGRFAPTGPVSSIFSAAASAKEPMIGVPFAIGAVGARAAATALRKNSVENLAAQMRLGAKPELSSRLQNVPLSALGTAPTMSEVNYLRNFITPQE